MAAGMIQVNNPSEAWHLGGLDNWILSQFPAASHRSVPGVEGSFLFPAGVHQEPGPETFLLFPPLVMRNYIRLYWVTP